MKNFQYSLGDRPLDGYTIKRGIGLGGFGEVYFALSDGGKEVALKLIRSNLEVELRGMKQCLNLKHANLVGLFDLRTDRQGNHWVVMEYVTGESLQSVLRRYEGGVAPELAREWFLGLAEAIHYLHDQGIVHRDLKPGNIFLEQGTIKVGDYGLCKFIGGSQHHGQTESVGTVYYMAPEVSTGNYNRQIDVYAAGVILFELLTGHVPFMGQTVGEILMKHLTSAPDLHEIPNEFVPILERALCKNPAHRYRTISEMAKDVRAIGEKNTVAATPAPETPVLNYEPRVVGEEITKPKTLPPSRRVAEVCGSLLASVFLAALLAVFWAAVVRTDSPWNVANYFFMTVSCCWAVIIATNTFRTHVEDSWRRRIVFLGLGLAIGLEAIWLKGYHLPDLETMQLHAQEQNAERKIAKSPSPAPPRAARLSLLAAYLTYFGLIFFIMRWWKIAEKRRLHRFSLYPVLAAGFWAYILSGFFANVLHTPLSTTHGRHAEFVALVMAAIIIQLVSPWERPAPARVRRVRLRYA